MHLLHLTVPCQWVILLAHIHTPTLCIPCLQVYLVLQWNYFAPSIMFYFMLIIIFFKSGSTGCAMSILVTISGYPVGSPHQSMPLPPNPASYNGAAGSNIPQAAPFMPYGGYPGYAYPSSLPPPPMFTR